MKILLADQNKGWRLKNMKKWYDEEYEFTVEVTGFLHGDHTERYCRNGEEVGDENFHKGGFWEYPDQTV